MNFSGPRKGNRSLKGFFVLLLLLTAANIVSGCGWIVYFDTGYHGTVIDAATKEPIPGAVIVAVYYAGCFRLVDGYSKTLGARETMTDVNGAFHTPLLLTANSPHCLRSGTDFIVFKAGYGYSPSPYLLSLPGSIPLDRPYEFYDFYSLSDAEALFRKGVVIELVRLENAERGGVPDTDSDLRSDLPELVKAVDAEIEYRNEHPPTPVIVRQEPILPSPPPPNTTSR